MTALIWAVFLLPGRLAGDRLDFALGAAAAAAGAAALWTRPSPWETLGAARRTALYFGALQVLYLFSWLSALAYNGAQTGLADLADLPRWLLLGTACAWILRQHDEAAREATARALTVTAWAALLLFDKPADAAYAAGLAFVWHVLFSKAPRRRLHAAASAVSWSLAFAHPFKAASAEAGRMIRQSPLLGWGPARYEALSEPGSQYVSWTLRGGFLGAAVIVTGVLVLAWNLLDEEDDLRRRAAVGVLLAAAPLLALAGPVLDGYRLVLWTAFVLAAARPPRGGAA